MNEFFNRISKYIKGEDMLTDSEGFDPPIITLEGMKFKVSPAFLTDEGKASLDKDGYITVRPFKL